MRSVSRLTTKLIMAVGVIALVSSLGSAAATISSRPSTTPTAVGAVHQITGVDLHDGMVLKDNGTYYLYGTEYNCGFQWGHPLTPWCGFGVSTAPSLGGPWSPITTLVSPNDIDTWDGLSWGAECGRGGMGCFNPRMVQRPDGVWILAFNSPSDWIITGANAYYFMGCESAAGPCGPGKGPHGSLRKPPLYVCTGLGDFSIFWENNDAYMACTMTNQTISVEKLDSWWTSGTGHGVANVAGLSRAEAPGAYFDTSVNLWIMTVSYVNCGYGTGCGTAYATAPSPLGPWSAPSNAGWEVDPFARAVISANSCGGQPRTVNVVDGVAYQYIDLWSGTANEAGAPVLLTPLSVDSLTTTRPWHPFRELACR